MVKPFPQKALCSLANLQDKTLSCSRGHKHPCLLHGSIYKAIRYNDMDKLKYLISQGVNVKDKIISMGKTPIEICAINDNGKAIKILKEAGVDINKKLERDESALFIATKHGNLFASADLISLGADVNAQDHNGDTPLMILLKCNRGSNAKFMLKRLLDAGADPNIANKDGVTPLMVSAATGSESVSISLIEAGAEPLSLDKKGNIAYDYLSPSKEQGKIGDVLNPQRYGHLNKSMDYK